MISKEEEGDPTAFGDDVAEKMRAFYETKGNRPSLREAIFGRNSFEVATADNLMLGLMGIVLDEYRVFENDNIK